MSFLSPSAKALACASILSFGMALPAVASERVYFKNVQGTWSGAGKIVAGKYKNTRFTCNLSGQTPARVGMKLSGKCRVGLFSQPIEAIITKRGSSYRGRFLDGAKGKGLDIVSGKLRGQKLVLGIKRKNIRGTMIARLKGRNKLNITILVRVKGGLVPFIGLTLARTGGPKKASVASN
ncbi:MAG: hypothetical protein V3V02_03625 [Rhizobiaceae bacterium]